MPRVPTNPFAARPRSSPWTKLCGIKDVVTAAVLAELRPDAIGLNFHPPSSRYVAPEQASEIRRVLPDEIAVVGVFVNAPVAELLRTIKQVGLTAVQFHGDEPPQTVVELKQHAPDVSVIRAWRVGEEGLGSLADHLAACTDLGSTPDAVLVDAKVAGEYGGTGRTAPWDLLRSYDLNWPPLILAGGLTPLNVSAAVATVRPWGVDTAGGVESSPGVKDRALAAAFLAAARQGTAS